MEIININSPIDLKYCLYIITLLAAIYFANLSRINAEKIFLPLGIVSIFYVTASVIDWLTIASKSGRTIRYTGAFEADKNPIYTSLIISTGLFSIYTFYIEEKTLNRKYFSILSFSATFFTIIACSAVYESRTTLVGLALLFAIYIIQNRLWTLGLILPLASLAIIYATGLNEVFASRGTSYRLEIWEDAIKRIIGECNLLFGCGADNYKFLGIFTQPHNSYLGINYEHGLTGLAFLLIGITPAIFWGLKNKSQWLALSAIGIGGLITTSGGVVGSPKPYWVYFWMPILMMEILRARSNKTENPEKLKNKQLPP